MTDSSEKRNGWVNFKLQSPHVIEMRSNAGNQAWQLNLTTLSITVSWIGGGGGGGERRRRYSLQFLVGTMMQISSLIPDPTFDQR